MSEWNGDLPKGWVYVPFGDLCTFAQNGCSARRGASGQPTVVLRLADVSTDGYIASQDLREINLSEQDRQKYALKHGDLLAYRVNGSSRIVGQVVHYPGPEGYAFCDHFIRFRTEDTVLEPKFAALAFRVPAVRKRIEARVVSSAGQNTVSQSSFSEISFPVPPLVEQRRIVAKIEALQERSRRAQEALSEVGPLLEQFRQSVLAAAFRGDLTADWRAAHPNIEPASTLLQRIRAERRRRWEQAEVAKYAAKGQKPPKNWQDKYEEPEPVDDSDPQELPEGWCWIRVAELASDLPHAIQSGPFGSNLLHSEFQDTGILAIGIDNVHRDGFSLGQQHRISREKYKDLKRYTARPLDVLVTVMATVGRCCLVPADLETAIITKHVYRITLEQRLMNPQFLALEFQGAAEVLKQLAKAVRGQTRPGINGQILKSLAIPVPPRQEQDVICKAVHNQIAGVNDISEMRHLSNSS